MGRTMGKWRSDKAPLEIRFYIMQHAVLDMLERGIEFRTLPYITHNEPATREEFARYLQDQQQITGRQAYGQ